jgi:streptogramin lyase
MTLDLRRRAVLVAVLLGVLAATCVGVAGATPLGQITEFAAPGTNIAQVRAGPDGNLWFTDRAGAIGRITTDGVITRFTSGLNPGSQPFSLAVGPDGNLWFTDAGTSSAIGTIDPSTHAIAEFSTGLNPGSKPAGIALGPDGNLWFSDRGSPPAIGTINPTTHASSEYSSGLNAGSLPQQGITVGPDGNIWFTDQGSSRAIGMLNPTTHAISEFGTGLNSGSAPGAAIAVGTDGDLWFTDNSTAVPAIGMIDPMTHAVSEFPSGAGSVPGRIAAGPDGNLWFTDKGTTPAIAIIDPTTHAITKYSSGLNAGSAPGGINTGSDGNVWFTDQGAVKAMGRVGTDAPTPSLTAPSISGTGGVGVAQRCGGDTWSSWAGEQPSRSAFGYDGYQWLLDGSPIAGATEASYTPAADQAGDQLSCEVTVTYTLLQVTVSATSAPVEVKGAAEQLSELAAAVVGVGPGASLAGKVAVIQDDVAANDAADACADLLAFGYEVNAQTGKKLSTAQAASLLAQAQDIEAALGC